MSDNKKKGFEGISSLATDLEEKQPNPSEKRSKEQEKPKRRLPIQADYSGESKNNNANKSTTPPESGKFWSWLPIVLIVIVGWNMFSNEESPSKRSITSDKPSYSPPAPKLTIPKPKVRKKLSYVMPPIGKNKVFSVPQIRWCLREKYRLDNLNGHIKNNTDVRNYNNKTTHYNSRCSAFRYRRGNLKRAKREVEADRINNLFN